MGEGRVYASVAVSPFSSPWGSGSFRKLCQLDKPMYSFCDELS